MEYVYDGVSADKADIAGVQRVTMKRRHNKVLVPIHFVWATHERMPLIPEPAQRRLWRYLETVCREVRCEVLAVGGMPDHIHLLVNFSTTMSIAQLMKRVKGSSSHFVSEQLREDGWFKWQDHYAAFAVEPARIANMISYIECQAEHHAAATTVSDYEETYTEHDTDEEVD